jgi:DNA-binding transcriptional LysR family regulator
MAGVDDLKSLLLKVCASFLDGVVSKPGRMNQRDSSDFQCAKSSSRCGACQEDGNTVRTFFKTGCQLLLCSCTQNIAGVRDGRLELAIIVAPIKANALTELRFQELATARVALAVSCNHPFARRQSVSLADAAREPFIGLIGEKYPRYEEYLAAIFARVNDKPRIVEEHDGWSGVFSAVSAGTGVALSSDAFSYMFNDRVKLLRLTPEPNRVAIGIIIRKEKLSPAAEKFCECAREAFSTLH